MQRNKGEKLKMVLTDMIDDDSEWKPTFFCIKSEFWFYIWNEMVWILCCVFDWFIEKIINIYFKIICQKLKMWFIGSLKKFQHYL